MSKIKPYLQILIASVLLFLLYRSGLLQMSKIKSAISNPSNLVLGLIIFSLQFFTFALRWKLTVSLLEKISLRFSIKLHLIGQFFNTFIPGGVGGDVIKAVELSKGLKNSRTLGLALILIDRVVGLYCLIIFSFLFLLVEFQQLEASMTKYLITSLILFCISTLALILRKKLLQLFNSVTQNIQNKFILNIKDTIFAFFNFLDILMTKANFNKFVFLSFIAQMLSILFLYLVVTTSIHSLLPFTMFFPLACFAFMAMAIPITPGGIGYGQAAFYFIFKSFGDDVAEAAIVGISMMQMFYLLLSLPGGYVFMRSTRRKSVENQNTIALK